MENFVILEPETAVVSGNGLKGEVMENRCPMDNASRKGLSDITNFQQQPKALNQGAKQLLQTASLRSKDYIDKLQQENMMLMKVLADRNKVIEMSGIELQKLRINLEKFQQQNLLLAQANSQMLAELNSGKDRLKALRHELGCKNAVLKAMQSEKKAKDVACPISGNEVGTNKCGQAGESLKEEDGEDKPCNMNRCGKAGESLKEEDEEKPCNRTQRRQSTSLCPSHIKQVQPKEGIDSKRVCVRRQSARFKAQEPETNEESFEVDDTKFLASPTDDKVHESGPSNIKPVQAKEGVEKKRRVCFRGQSARFKAQETETTEESFEVDDTKFLVSSTDDKMHESGPSNIKPVQAKEGVENKSKVRLRRESARFKAQEPETTEDVFEVDDTKFLASSCDNKLHKTGPSNIKSTQAEERGDNKRVCLRRQSARLKGQEPEMTEDAFEVDDARFLVSSSCDDKVHKCGPPCSGSSVKSEHEERSMTPRNEAQELKRTSMGRPLRRAAEKVQSYKEMKLNVKMRREE